MKRGLGWRVVAALLTTAAAAHAQTAWVKGEVRLNLRTGPGNEYRILGSVKTGDGVQLLERSKDWTRVRTPDQREGWIPAGYLLTQPPPAIRLPEIEAELDTLRAKLGKLGGESTALRTAKESLDALTSQQEKEITRLDLENRSLKAGARWPEWITGASLLGAGMILGAFLQHGSTRRRQPRIRL